MCVKNMLSLKVQLLSPHALTPFRKSGSAGYDLGNLYATIIPPYTQAELQTGVCIEIPNETIYGRIAMRSGWAAKGLIVNAGVIDSDYRGPLICLVYNSSAHILTFQ
jgi:dUTP pyrophosphatase